MNRIQLYLLKRGSTISKIDGGGGTTAYNSSIASSSFPSISSIIHKHSALPLSSPTSSSSSNISNINSISSSNSNRLMIPTNRKINRYLTFNNLHSSLLSFSHLQSVNNNNNNNQKSYTTNNNNNDNKDQKQQQQQQQSTNEQQPTTKEIRYKGIILLTTKMIDKIKFVLTRHRPITSDQMFAIFSWLLFGTGSLIILGTTTLVSLILWIANTFEFSEWTAKKIGKYLTNNTGIQITFEHARGEWKTGYIRLENVTVSRKPKGDERLSTIQLNIKHIDIKLSILWMLEGKGIIQECLVSGVRGIVDRRTEGILLNYTNATYPRRKKARGDFVFNRLDIKDLLVTYYLPDSTHRPLSISIFSLESDRFRKQWILYDLLSSKNIVGKFDDSLFTYTIPQFETNVSSTLKSLDQRELKIDGVDIQMLSRNATGPLGWIKEGTFDINLNLLLPNVSEYEVLTTEHDTYEYGIIPLDKDPFKNVHLQFSVSLNHLYSVAPIYTPELSYLSNAMAHPIVAYINSHSKRIHLQFNFSMNIRQYNGSWTLSQANFWEMMSAAVGRELVARVQEKKNVTTLKEVASELIGEFMEWIGPIIEQHSQEYYQLLKEQEEAKNQSISTINNNNSSDINDHHEQQPHHHLHHHDNSNTK